MIEAPTRRTFALASCAALAALVWLLGTWFEGPAGVGGIAPGEVRGRAEAPPDAGTSAQDRQDDNDRAATAHAAAAPQRQRERSPVLHVRLRGLHASAPWTASLELEIDALDAELQLVHHEDKQVPDAEGRVAFALPASLDGLVTNGGIDADDANYLPLHRGWKEVLDLTREVEIDVQVVAVLQGRVVDGRSAPVPAARIVAFEQRDGQPLDRKLGECNTDAGGAYSLRVPPNIELFLVASPMQRRGSLDRTTNDTGELRSDLLPATQRAAGVLGSATTLADFVLRDATPVTGVVRWSNGTPVQLATVRCEPRRGAHLTISPGASLCIDANGDLCPGSRTDTDEQGRFALAAVPGAALDVIVDCVPTVLVVGDALRREAVPSVPVEMVIPAPITLRCVRAGSPLPEAEIAIEGWREHTTAANGELRFVLTQESVRVRATHEHLRSEWRTLGPEHAGQRVVLELVESLGEVSLEFEGEFRVRNTLVRWHRADGREGAEQLLRGERSGPFRIFLEAGHYRLQIGPAPGDRNGRFLLPIERDVEVGGAPVRLVVPASFGGRFTVHATDGSGLYVGGTCRVYDAAGTDCSDRFSFELDEARGRRTSGVGELVEGGPNEFRPVLPAGEYLLQFDFGTHGLQQRRVTIQSREWLDVHVRLPD